MPSTNTSRIDGLMTSVAVKAPVKAVSNAPLTLSGLQTVNGVALVSGDRVLVKNQSAAIDNGIYDANSADWTRSKDFDGNRDIVNGTRVFWAGGPGWWRVASNEDLVVVGTDTLTFIPSDEPQILHVNQFGAIGDGVTDDTQAIKNACIELNANGGGVLLFDPVVYRIYPTGTFAGAPITMNTFTGCAGIYLNGQGAELSIQDTFGAGENLSIFEFATCVDTTVANFTFRQTIAALSGSQGQAPINLSHRCVNFLAHNIIQYGGLLGVRVDRTPVSQPRSTYGCENITLHDFYIEDTEYGMNFQSSGDNVKAWNFHTVRCGRSYFPYGVRTHDIHITIDGQLTSPSCFVGTGVASDNNFIEDIKLDITAVNSTNPSEGNLVGLNCAINSADPHPAIVRNIEVNFNIAYVDASPSYGVVWIGKTNTVTGLKDDTDRGHTYENIGISGNIHLGGNHGALIALMSPTANNGTWGPGEFVRNLRVHDLTVTSTADTHLEIGLGPIVDMLQLENLIWPTLPTFTGVYQRGIHYKNCTFGSTYYSDVVDSLKTVTGSAALPLAYRTINLNTTGGGTYSLADGVEGQQLTITMTVDGGDGIVTPATFVGAPSSTITFNDVGDTASLLFTAGAWVFLGGTATVA